MTIPQALELALQHHQSGRLAEAEALYRQILAAQPNHADALHLLGVIAHQGGRHDLAADLIRRAIAINPAASHYFVNLGNALAAQRRPDEAIASFRRALQLKPGDPDAHNNLGNAMVVQGRLEEAIASFHREDGVDILADLTQHMAGNRLSMFARKPAPVQVSFAGYPASTGLEAIEYRISDRYLEPDPARAEAGGKERVCLIDSFWCYDPCGTEVEVNPLPALESGMVTFGCLNNFCKVNERVLNLWARALGEVKDSRLIIASPAGRHRERTPRILESEGVEARRVEFVDLRERREYLELYHRLDIALDTFPYNGGVTTCDALWMGVPVLTLRGGTPVSRAGLIETGKWRPQTGELPGGTPVSRAGLSLLSNAGLAEFAASSEEDYVRIAVELAGNLPRLAALRATLRSRMQSSPMMDAAGFARNIEGAYRSMWERWSAAAGFSPSPTPRDA